LPKFQTLAKFVYINEQKTVRAARADGERTNKWRCELHGQITN